MLGPQDANKAGMKTLVLDLDETLVRSQFEPPPKYDLLLPVRMEDKVHQVYVAIRPGMHEFLAEMAKCYELVIFTASLSKYANPLMDILDPKELCSARLFREHCTYDENVYVKDMAKIGRPIEDVILIDNNINSYRFQPENALPITSWYKDQTDTELYKLMPFLIGLSKIPDVRTVLGVVHKDHQLNLQKAEEMVDQILKEKQLQLLDLKDSQTHQQQNRVSNINSSDFDLNDRTSDAELLSIMQQPIRSQQQQQQLQHHYQSNGGVSASVNDLHGSSNIRQKSIDGCLTAARGTAGLSQQFVGNSQKNMTRSASHNNQQDNNQHHHQKKLTQSNTDQKLPITSINPVAEYNSHQNVAGLKRGTTSDDALGQEARMRFQENFAKMSHQKTLNDVAFRNQKISQLDSSSNKNNNDQDAANNYKQQQQIVGAATENKNKPPIVPGSANAVGGIGQQLYQNQGGQGTQGACMNADESMLASNRTFANERTDLTQTEISPRGHQPQIIEQFSGKSLEINTRLIKPSQEKKSIKMLNIKGHIQTNRQRHILRSLQSSGNESAGSKPCLSLGMQPSQASNSSSHKMQQINVLRQNLMVSGQASDQFQGQSRDQLLLNTNNSHNDPAAGNRGLLSINSPNSQSNMIGNNSHGGKMLFNDRRLNGQQQALSSPKTTPAILGTGLSGGGSSIPPKAEGPASSNIKNNSPSFTGNIAASMTTTTNLNQHNLGNRSGSNQNAIANAAAAPQIQIDISDDKRCNLEDDDEFYEQHKGGTTGAGSASAAANLAAAPNNGRNLMTPTGLTSRKSSINATPKSRVIEPGKIFNQRHMTPSSAGGLRGRMGGLWPQKLDSDSATNVAGGRVGEVAADGMNTSTSGAAATNQHHYNLHKHSRSNHISATEVQQQVVSGFINHKKRGMESIGSSLLKL